jgi:S-DNA-T family DNA segregation ATPase FtsK/SpoIIIE
MPRKKDISSKKRSGPNGKKSPANPLRNLFHSVPLASNRRTIHHKPNRSTSTMKTFSGLTLDQRLDIVGVIFTLTGFLLLFSLLSTNQGSFTENILIFIIKGFGWSGYFLPIALLGIGIWLILRRFEKIPRVSLERIVGICLLFISMVGLFHFISNPSSSQESFELARNGIGGGYLGALIFNLFEGGLGKGGSIVTLIALLIIALALTIDVPVSSLFHWLPALITRIQDTWDERQAQSNQHKQPNLPTFHNLPPQPYSSEINYPETNITTKPNTQSIGGLISSTPSTTTNWKLPVVEEILELGNRHNVDADVDQQRAATIEESLASFSAPGKIVEIKRGPTITLFGVEPDFIETRTGKMRVRVSKITALADDLALALSARTIRIQAPVPGKGYVGIEVPNEKTSLVALRDVIESEAFKRLKSPLRFALGEDVAGNAVAADLAAMPHLLIAGTTGSGKSVCVNSLICCLLMHNTPNELRLLMVDPKRVELTNYNGIPHLLAPVVVDLERVVGALQWVTREMDQRYHKLAEAATRNITDYNNRMAANGERLLPHLVVFIDELADLMMLAPDETERTITRLAQLARATGIHLVIATQRPSVDVVTGLIKANFPARIAFVVASGVDSRVILDQPGAERLLGRGDMLFQAPDAPAPVRLQGTFVSDAEIQQLVDYWRQFSGTMQTYPSTLGGAVDQLPQGIPLKQIPLWEEMKAEENLDPLMNEATDLVRRQGRASISMLQRHFRIGYTRSARLIESMEEKGIVGLPLPGTGAREVLDYGPAAPPEEA